jgi:hypothetical protein
VTIAPAHRRLLRLVRQKLARLALVLLLLLLPAGVSQAQAPLFELSSSPTTVIATGGSEVLGTLALTADVACGGSADGKCISSPGVIQILYDKTAVDNSLATGITVTEFIGGAATTAPAPGKLISGVVTIANSPLGGSVSITVNGGVDMAAGDSLIINGVRGEIVSSPASVPGTLIDAQISTAGINVGFFFQSEIVVSQSAVGLQFISMGLGPGAGTLSIIYQEGFAAAFVQNVPTAKTGIPANPRPSFGSLNNTQVHFTGTGLAGRLQWPQTVASQLAGGGGVASGGSELQLVSQNFDGSEAKYEFATADQSVSDLTQEIFVLRPTECGAGSLAVQAQLFPKLGGRPGFNDPLAPSAPTTISGFSSCIPSPLAVISGDNQFGVVGTPLPQPLVVKAQDGSGNPVSGLMVSFEAVSTGGSVFPALVTTDDKGMAQTIATLGPALGNQVFTAMAGSISRTFVAIAVAVQVPPFPITKVVPHVVTGNGFQTTISVINLTGQVNPIQINLLSQAGDLVSTETHTLPPSGRIDVIPNNTERLAGLTIQWAAVGSQLPIGVSSLLELEQPGSEQPVTAVSFPSPDPQQTMRLPFAFVQAAAGEQNPLTAGLALANFSPAAATIELDLFDQGGAEKASDKLALPPFGQTTLVVPERPPFQSALTGQAQFSGFLTVSSSSPIAVIDAGSDFSQFFSVPQFQPIGCSVTPFSNSQMISIPHIAVGGGWATRIAVTNLCSVQNSLTIEVFDQAGTPVDSFIGTSAMLGPSETDAFSSGESSRAAPLSVAWARITSQLGVGIHVLLDFREASEQVPTSAIGTSQSHAFVGFLVPVDFAPASADQESPRVVGLALANASNETDAIVLELLNSQGQEVAEDSSLTLPPLGQTAVFVTDLGGFRDFQNPQSEFSGTLRVVTSQPTTVLAVGFDHGPSFNIPTFFISP